MAVCLLVSLLAAAAAATARGARAPPLLPLLLNASDWILALPGLRENNVTANSAINKGLDTSIFINGNLARVLLAASRISGRAEYLDAGLAWCDTFAALQRPIRTSRGMEGGWWDTGYNELFLADTGTAVLALSLCWWLAPPGSEPRRAVYETALRRYVAFVTDGCIEAPANGTYGNACPPAGQGWLLRDGSLGDGYYMGALNNFSYTIATATTGSAFLPAWWRLPVPDHVLPRDEVQAAAVAAVRWLVDGRSADGRIPYVITPADPDDHDLQCVTYSAESFVSVGTLFAAPATARLLQPLNSTVDWLLRTQNADGSWGAAANKGERERSPRAASLLQWYAASYPATAPLGLQAALEAWEGYVAAGGGGLMNDDTMFTGFAAPWALPRLRWRTCCSRAPRTRSAECTRALRTALGAFNTGTVKPWQPAAR